MRLILTEYINSLKEDGELDKVIQDILIAHDIEIFSAPERGRQYGVDIYAVGKDFEDNNRKKVFLITVKQGDIDRQKWNVDQNSVHQSLEEIRTVFIRNNLAPQHVKLPKKIIVASNGRIKQSIQQNWRGYVENCQDHEYEYWGIGFLTNQFQANLLNDDSFSNEVRSLIRKTIINLENPNYDLKDYNNLLKILLTEFQGAKQKRKRIKLLKQLRLIVSIITKYCQEADNLKHAVKCVERYILYLWPEVAKDENNEGLVQSFLDAYHDLAKVFLAYYHKISYISLIEDGFGKNTHEALIYTDVLYEQIGIFSLCGVILLQMVDLTSEKNENISSNIEKKAEDIVDSLIHILNNNRIFFNPRADDHHIEINLLLILLYRLNRINDIRSILQMFCKQIGEGFVLSKIFPVFSNSTREIAELDVNYEKRKDYEYSSSTLFVSLVEWTLVLGNEKTYKNYVHLKKEFLKDIDLALWFPDKDTEAELYTKNTVSDTGYTLTGIELSDNFEEYKALTIEEHTNNCTEKDFSFMEKSFWSIGLIAARHYRTYIFPHYWRQFIVSDKKEV